MGLTTIKLGPDCWQDWFLYRLSFAVWRTIRSVDWRLPVLGAVLATGFYLGVLYDYHMQWGGMFDHRDPFPGIEWCIAVHTSGKLAALLTGLAGLTAFAFTIASCTATQPGGTPDRAPYLPRTRWPSAQR